MKNTINSGNKGKNVRGDCFVTYDPNQNGKLDIQIDSKVEVYYGKSIRSLAKNVFNFFNIEHGYVHIEDSGALDFVLAARIECCIKKVFPTEKNFILDRICNNTSVSKKNRIRQSRLYVPGNSPNFMINAGIHRPNCIILDLEDSVSPTKKDEARLLVRNALRGVDFYDAERMVRINQLPMGLNDLEQIIPHGVNLVLIPKCESSDDVKTVNTVIERIRKESDLNEEILLMPIIENCIGVLKLEQIAASAENIVGIAIGLEDYCSDLGVIRTNEGKESFYARSKLVNTCKAYRIQAIDSIFSDLHDIEGLKMSVNNSKALGFDGVGCIHPRQIKIIHDVFAPSEDEINYAKQVFMAYEEASEAGLGVVSLGSKMIDPPVVERAKQTIALAVDLGIISKDWRVKNE